MRTIYLKMIFIFLLFTVSSAYATTLEQLQQAYPEHIKSVQPHFIIWQDNSKMWVNPSPTNKTDKQRINHPTLSDQLNDAPYPIGKPQQFDSYQPQKDPGRIRYEPFFMKMYGENKAQVEKNLTTIYWLQNLYGKRYPLQVSTVNQIDKKLIAISNEIEKLVQRHPEYLKYVINPDGVFNWRPIKETHRLSAHSYGIAIDLNTAHSSYWQWDLQKAQRPINENEVLTYSNEMPWPIIAIFEKYGFIWGGKWYHYDTMHFEYRPELFMK